MSDVDQPPPDERAGMAWWNDLSEAARLYWLRQAGDTGRVADAWAVYQREGKRPNCPPCVTLDTYPFGLGRNFGQIVRRPDVA